MNKDLISVVIPAHNSERYIEKCLNSVIHQTYKNLQIIVVNDGSTDSTQEILSQYEKKDKRITAMNKIQGGVSSARNIGLSIAEGEYVVFVDSDDWLDQDILRIAIEGFQRRKLNFWGYKLNRDGKDCSTESILFHELSQEEILAHTIYSMPNKNCNLGNCFRAVWGKLFENSIIRANSIIFPEDLYMGEDAIFLLNYLTYVTGANLLSKDGYNYNRGNEWSTTSRFHKDLFEQNSKQYNYIRNSLDNDLILDSAVINDALVNFRWSMFTSLFHNSKAMLQQGMIWNIFADPARWIREYRNDMKIKAIEYKRINGMYKPIYLARNLLFPYGFCFLYFCQKVVAKCVHKIFK